MRKIWLDFETRSFVNLPDYGLDRYSKDITTEVLMLAWAFDDDEPKLWLPCLGEPMPAELHAGLIDPTVMKMAWNYNFEKDIFHYRLGYVIPQQEWFDPSVLCAYMSLPIGLDRAADALDIDIELKKTVILGKKKPTKIFSEPSKRNKTFLKKNPGAKEFYFRDWNSDPEQWEVFKEYCLQDVRAERAVWYAAVAMNCPITEGETQAWLLDQRMNEQGVWIDKVFVQNSKAYALGEIKEINATMQTLTGLAYTKSGKSLSKLDEWLQSKGYKFDSLDKAHIAEALKVGLVHWKMDPVAYQVLQLKEKLGGSAYTKLQTIEDRIGADGRLRDQFVYHGAHTGRWSGRGVQLQNLFKPSKDVSTLRERIVNAIRSNTLDVAGLVAEYNAEVLAFNATNTDPKKERKPIKSMTLMAAVAGTIRASFSATPGFKLSVSDLAQIESRVLAALAGCQTMINAYAKGLDLYKDIMSFLLNKPYADITSAERANGKVIILGCFEENTLVLTDSGWKRILDVEKADLVFDGLNFVAHGGVIAQGKKEVIPVCGVGVTPDHRFLSKGWVEACRLQKSIQLEQQASSLGIGSFLSIDSTRFPLDTCASAKGVTNASLLTKLTWKKGELGHAYPVLTDGFGKNKTGYTSDGHTSPEKSSTDLQTDTTPSSLALDRLSEDAVGSDTLVEELRTDSRVSMTSSGTSRLSTDMNLLARRLTESIMTDTTNEETSSSLPDEKISKTEVDTFDILNAGPNSRFMILTTSGPMIVHNCGFGMGWEKFIEYAATFGVTLDEKTAKTYVNAFREKYSEIPAYWKELNAAVIKATKGGVAIYVRGVVVDGRNPKMLKIKLPSGRALHYLNPRVEMSETDWGVMQENVLFGKWDAKGLQENRLYGGLICENIVQAVARDILLAGMLEAEKIGFIVIMTIHDEVVAESKLDSKLTYKDLEHAMTITPEWAEGMGFVLAAEGYDAAYYRKG
jgi:hypothetical protein